MKPNKDIYLRYDGIKIMEMCVQPKLKIMRISLKTKSENSLVRKVYLPIE
jgi:hypothetical protein